MNRIAVTGRLAQDPVARKTREGSTFTTFSLAVSRFAKDQADFFHCVAFKAPADFIANFAHRGDLVAIEGEVRSRSFVEKNGESFLTFEIIVDSVDMLSSREERERRIRERQERGEFVSTYSPQANQGQGESFGDMQADNPLNADAAKSDNSDLDL